MLVKHVADHIIVQSQSCGKVHDIITNNDNYPLGIAVCFDIPPTKEHFHKTFDEIYFVLDGQIVLELYDPIAKSATVKVLNANELCVVSKGIHHKIIKSSEKNRLAVISYPPFQGNDEHSPDYTQKK